MQKEQKIYFTYQLRNPEYLDQEIFPLVEVEAMYYPGVTLDDGDKPPLIEIISITGHTAEYTNEDVSSYLSVTDLDGVLEQALDIMSNPYQEAV